MLGNDTSDVVWIHLVSHHNVYEDLTLNSCDQSCRVPVKTVFLRLMKSMNTEAVVTWRSTTLSRLLTLNVCDLVKSPDKYDRWIKSRVKAVCSLWKQSKLRRLSRVKRMFSPVWRAVHHAVLSEDETTGVKPVGCTYIHLHFIQHPM